MQASFITQSVLSLRTMSCLIITCLILQLGACANEKDDKEKSERALYQSAQKALDNKQYEYALELFRKIELRYPFGRYAEQAQLESIYAYYENTDYAAAEAAAGRFLQQYPEHPNLDYVQYLKGLSNYHVDKSFLSRFVENASAKRDLNSAKLAYLDFKRLIEVYPLSDYAADAQKRMLYIRDLVALQEIEIAHYYMQRAAYVAAVTRSQEVIEKYPGTSASAHGLALTYYAYQQLGSPDLAADSLKVLKHNFPNYEKLQEDGSLIPYDKLYQDRIDLLNFISFGHLNKEDTTSSSKAPSSTAPKPKPSEAIPSKI